MRGGFNNVPAAIYGIGVAHTFHGPDEFVRKDKIPLLRDILYQTMQASHLRRVSISTPK